ncbi:MAG: F0F1 ATP synthase subunit alpha [Planctomycetota bacterium]|nr:F0F1 ATP synthase subunit alpha [Planctomycetota bacterium]
MKIKTDEIVSVIKQEIESFSSQLEISEVGRVVEVGDGIARIYGLSKAKASELIEFQTKTGSVMGQVMNLEEDTVGAVIFGDYLAVKEGDTVKATGNLLSVPVGEAMLGRVVNPLGVPLDDGAEINATETSMVDIIAPGIAARQPVHEPLQTGIKAIDAMIPVGRGQRELIIGDRKTGKTAVAIDAIINQKQYWGTKDAVVCVYVAVGQKASTVANVVAKLQEAGAMDYTIVVQASASDPAPMQYVAPYAGCSLAEYFMYEKGAATLVVYDDLSKQANAYRELSLLLRRPPGREAYPGDVFYLHSRLLERSVKMKDKWVIVEKTAKEHTNEPVDGRVFDRNDGEEIANHVIHGFDDKKFKVAKLTSDNAREDMVGKYAIVSVKSSVPEQLMVFDTEKEAKEVFGGMKNGDKHEVRKVYPSGGSLTALPIIETQEGEVSAYIPTNVISITDGQIYLEPNLFFAGIRPAINVGISVSRVGGSAQIGAMKAYAKSLRLDLASYWDLEAFAQLGTDLDAATKAKLERGKRMVELLKQGQYRPMAVEDQVIMIYAGNEGVLDTIPQADVLDFETKVLQYIHSTHNEIPTEIREKTKMSKDLAASLLGVLKDYAKSYNEGTAPDPRTQAKKDEKADA